MKALRIHEAARREANLAAVGYKERSARSAQRFVDDLLAGFLSAAASPLRHPNYLHETRRVVLKRSPYLLCSSIGRMRFISSPLLMAREGPATGRVGCRLVALPGPQTAGSPHLTIHKEVGTPGLDSETGETTKPNFNTL